MSKTTETTTAAVEVLTAHRERLLGDYDGVQSLENELSIHRQAIERITAEIAAKWERVSEINDALKVLRA